VKYSRQFGAILVGALVAACGDGAGDAGKAVETPIINGSELEPVDFKALTGVVEINTGGAQPVTATGVLLRNDWVLTARHIFFEAAAPNNRIPDSEFFVLAPGQFDPVGVISQQAAIDRVYFHPLGSAVDVALVHLTKDPADPASTGRFKSLLGPTQHEASFFQGPYSNAAFPDGLVTGPVTCFGYGRTVATDGASVHRLNWGASVVEDVNAIGIVDPSETRISGALNVFTRLLAGPTGQLPTAGDSGGPCFFGTGLIGLHSLGDTPPNVVRGQLVQTNAFEDWASQIMFEISASELDDTTDATAVPQAGSDMLINLVSGGAVFNVGVMMGAFPGGPGGQRLPVAQTFPIVQPVLPETFVDNGLTFITKVNGLGEFNRDGMADVVVSFDALEQPFTFVVAYVSNSSNGTNARVPIQLFGMTNEAQWEIASVTDINGDGLSDLLWRSAQFPGFHAGSFLAPSNSGTPTMLSSFILPAFPQRDPSGADLPGTVDPAWRLVGAGDFDRALVSESNGVRDLTAADLVWHNQDTGEVELWSMGFRQGAHVPLATFPLLSRDPDGFEVVAFGDYTRDGTPDIIWRDRDTPDGLIDVWALTFNRAAGIVNRQEFPVLVQSGGQLQIPLDFTFKGPR